MSKQDRQGARTASDLEQKYSFGKTFAEIISNTDKAMEAAQKAAASYEGLDQDTIFNILTNNGKAQGVYRQGEDIYVNASYIGTGQIKSRNFADDYMTLVRYSYEDLDAITYWFRLDERSTDYYHFTATKAIPFGGAIRFYKSTMRIKTIDASGDEIETVGVTLNSYENGTELELDVSIYFSESGTKFDLDNGEIISSQFAIKSDGKAYFGGELKVDYGQIGAFRLGNRGLSATSSNGCGVMLFDNWLYFKSDTLGTADGSVTFEAGNMGVNGNPHMVEIRNTNGCSMKVTKNSANLTGAWKATPYTGGDEPSEVVTKQDLMYLGLIPRG